MWSKYKIEIACSIIVTLSCNAGDKVITLRKNYELIQESHSNNFLIGAFSIPANITKYAFNDKYILIEQHPDEQAYIETLGYDLLSKYKMYHNYMKAKGRNSELKEYESEKNKLDSNLYVFYLSKGVSQNNAIQDQQISREIADSIIHNDITYKEILARKINYWIVSYDEDKLYGPFAEDDYQKKMKELNINLKLKDLD